MARVTVEDCVDKIPNRFELVLMAGQRSRQISSGAELLVDRDRDKNPVVALREIAEETVSPEALSDRIVSSLQKVHIDEDDVAGAAATSVAHADLHEVIGLCRKALIGSRGAYDPWAAPGGFDPSGLVKGWAAQRAIEASNKREVVPLPPKPTPPPKP